MIERIVPSAVRVVTTRKRVVDLDLFPCEEQAIARAVLKRREEFMTVRACARTALTALGYPPSPLVPGNAGAPTWPDGVMGSMTHCDSFRAAAVALKSHVHALGIDAEPAVPLPEGVLELIAHPDELDALPTGDIAWDRLLFSAKESVYKAWFPLTQRYLDFSQAKLTVNPAGTFIAELLLPGPVVEGHTIQQLNGRWIIKAGILATAVTIMRGLRGSDHAQQTIHR